jgi:hypothetical protein
VQPRLGAVQDTFPCYPHTSIVLPRDPSVKLIISVNRKLIIKGTARCWGNLSYASHISIIGEMVGF